jgi:phosphoglycerol geranylgeranyltransferase
MNSELLSNIQSRAKQNHKMLAVLIDPDKADSESLVNLVGLAASKVDFFLVGGSLVTGGNMDATLQEIKKHSDLPCIIFPGSPSQISAHADAIFLLSLISGRNPDLLIGKHVEAAADLKKSNLQIIPTGYLLVDGGRTTTVSYISATVPIPADKPEIAGVTALAGEQLGLKIIYLDAGSGAMNRVPAEMIKAVRNLVSLPIVVGGGIKTRAEMNEAWEAGADVVVVGNHLETNPDLLKTL